MSPRASREIVDGTAFEAFRSWPLFRIIWSHYNIQLGSGASVKLRGGFLRSPGPFPEPTSFANCLAIGLIATYAMKHVFRSGVHHAAIMAVVVLGIIAPQSRGGWMGALVGVVAFQLFHRGMAKVGQLALFGVVAALAVVANATVADRIASTLGIGGGPDYRVGLFNRGVEEVKRYPFIGRPIDQVLFSLRDLVQGEGMVDFVNTYLYVALITGLIGMIVFMVNLVWPFVPLWSLRTKRAIPRVDQPQIAFVFSAATAMIVMLSVQSLTGRIVVMIVVLMAMSASALNFHRSLVRRPAPSQGRQPVDAEPLPAA
jgi:O-antigen ligase